MVLTSPSLARLYNAYHRQYAADLIKAVFTVSGHRLNQLLVTIGELADFPTNFTMLRWTCALRDYLAGKSPEQLLLKMGKSVVVWKSTLDKLARLAAT